MDFIFNAMLDALKFLAANETVLWLVGLGIVAAYFLANLFFTPYAKYKRILKKDLKYLKQCRATKSPVNVNKIVLPQSLAQGFENYLKSDSRFPSELIAFQPVGFKNIGITAVALFFALSAAVLSASAVKYFFAPFVLLALFAVLQNTLAVVRNIKHGKAKKLTQAFSRCLDRALGQSKQLQNRIDAEDVCLDKEVDDVISKINFLKANGINEDTAKEVAALLSNDRLNKVRTHEQQKRLNLALNGLLQVMTKKQEKTQQLSQIG